MEEQQPQQQQGQDLPPAVVKVRWKPNEEQLRMLVRLFEEEGDSINKSRIKEIALDLARQGDVTEANVHNWFHNRKARAKRKQKLMQQNDGESEVDTDVDSKGKRSKLDHGAAKATGTAAPSPAPAAVNGSIYIPEFAEADAQRGFPMRQPLRLPSDAVNLNSRMYENSLMLTTHQGYPPHQTGLEKFRVPGYSQDLGPDNHMIDWRPHPLSLMPTQPSTDLGDRSSESKTITDDASTESEDFCESRAWNSKSSKKSSWKKKGKGTMIRKPVDRSANGRRHHGSSRRSRIRDIIKGLKRNGDTYERDLKALFVEVVRRLGVSKSRSILSRLTRPDTDTSSASHGMDSASCSSTASLPRQARKVSSSSPSADYVGSRAGGEHFYNDPGYRFKTNEAAQGLMMKKVDLEQPPYFSPSNPCYKQQNSGYSRHWDSARHELTLSNCSSRHQQQQQQQQQQHVMTLKDKSSTSNEDEGSYGAEEETDGDKEEFRIVWSSQKKQEALGGGMFSPSFEDTAKKEKPAKLKLELGSEGEKTNVTLIDGKPTGPTGTWWNSILRHSALLFLDISIPHIALQPEEGLVRIRDYMDSKFTYVGGTLDDAYLKKQVAKALNFRRHKVMRMIEQGASRPSDISEEQWDSLIKYYADPKRREKSDKQRAALKALNSNNHHHHHQHHQQQQQQLQQQQQQQIQQQQQVQVAHTGLNLNVSISSQPLPLAIPTEPDEEDEEEGEPPVVAETRHKIDVEAEAEADEDDEDGDDDEETT